MKRTLLLLAGLGITVFFAGRACATSVSHVVCAKGDCGLVYDCPQGWSEENIGGTHLNASYRYDCTETISNATEVPSNIAPSVPNAPQAQAASNGYSLNYTLSYLVSEKLSCPPMVVNYTPGTTPPAVLALPVTSTPIVQSAEAGSFQVIFTCTYIKAGS